MRGPTPPSEAERLRVLRSYGVLDTPREKDYDDIVAFLARSCETPVAFVSLIDEDRQWFKAEVGLGTNETSLSRSICVRAIETPGYVEIADTHLDARSQALPPVVGDPGLRFYASACLLTSDGFAVGTLGVADYVPRRLTELQRSTLELLARQVMTRLELQREVAERSRSEAFLDLITDKLPVRIGYIGPDMRYRYLNGVYERAFGYGPGEGVGLTVRELAGEDSYRKAEPFLRRALAGETTFQSFEVDYPFGRRHVEVNYIPDVGDHGAVDGVVVHVSDVTGRVGTERRLEEARARHDQALERASVGTFDWDVREDRVVVNAQLARWFGLSQDEAVGYSSSVLFSAIHPDDRPASDASIEAAMRSGGRYETQYRVVGVDGRERWLFTRGDATLNSEGKAVRVSGVLLDVSERVAADQARRESERRVREAYDILEGIVESTSEMVAAVDCDRRFIAMNEAFRRVIRRLFGREPEVGGDLLEMLSDVPEDRAKAEAYWNRALAGEEVGVREAFGDGALERRVFDLRFYPIRDASGRIVGAAETARDVTERAHAEEERERLLAELEVERAKLVTLFQLAPAFIAVLRGPELVFEYVNDAFYGIVGHRPLVGLSLAEALPEAIGGEEGRDYDRVLRDVLESGETRTFDERRVVLQRVPEGPLEERFVDLAYQPLREADGAVTGVLVHGIDVTPGVIARRRIEASEAKYRTLFTSMDEGYCVIEMIEDGRGGFSDYRFLEINDAFERLTGIPFEWARGGKTARESIPDLEEFWFEMYGEVARTGEAVQFTQGSVAMGRWYEVRAIRVGGPGSLQVAVLFNDVSERKAVEFERERLVAELAAEREKLDTVLALSPSFVAIFRRQDLAFEYANPAYQRLVGNRELVGRPLAEALPELVSGGELGQEYDRLLLEVIEQNEPRAFIERAVRFRRPEGGWAERILDFTCQPLREADGSVGAVLVHGADVTDRTLAEREIAQREELFRTVFEQAPDDAILVMDLERVVTAWNPAAERICGWSADEAIGQSADRVFSPEDRKQGLPERETALAASGGKAADERWHMRRDGSRFWGIGTVNSLHDSEGKVRGYLKVFRDATERYEETRTLAFLRLLTDIVIDQRDPNAIIGTAERMLGEYLGVTRVLFAEADERQETVMVREEWAPEGPSIVGTHRIADFGPIVEADFRKGTTHVSYDAEKEYSLETGLQAIRKIGAMAGISVPIMKEGRLTALFVVHHAQPREWTDDEVGLVRQVADRMFAELERARAEAALRRMNETLETTVHERTEELRFAVREAEGFNYSISHDLRTPLRAMVSTSSILLEEAGPELNDEHRTLLARQVDNAIRMGRLIDELLRLSRLSRVEVNRQALDISAKARSVFEEIQNHDEANGCRLEVMPGMTAQGDPGLVRTVLHNLIGNACKFSPNGGTVRVGQEGGAFYVSDEGVGFDMRFATKIFLPFERLVPESEFPGTGIGLANVERIVRRHGGRIEVESEPGKGTTFRFTLA